MTPRNGTMDARARDRLAAPLVAVYWAALVGGLALYTWTRDDAADVAVLWAGALGGTALGQILALRNLRGWAAAALVLGATLVAAPAALALGVPGTFFAALLPAALCGFASLGERGAAAAFWFPAMTWMLTVVDRLDGEAAAETLDRRALVLLGAVAVGFVALLWAAERRRLGLWRAGGTARATAAATLREPPGRAAARVAWGLAVAAVTLAVTTCVAPRLWRAERLAERRSIVADAAGGGGHGLPCCPVVDVAAPRVRVREFLDVAHGVSRPPPRVGVDCSACADGPGVAPGAAAAGGGVAAVAPSTAAAAGSDAPGTTAATAPSVPVAPQPTEPTVPVDPWHAPVEPPATATPTPTQPPTAPEPAADPPLPVPATDAPVAAATVRAAPPPAPADDGALLRLLLTLAVAAAAFALATATLRPLRRAVTLRHLRRPYWAEPLQQRISNLWQLVLVGLRDAGLCAHVGEPAEALARRARVDGVAECAAVLERARHGLGVDEAALAEMARAAGLAYRAARARLSWWARAVGWLRWPLT